MNLNLQNTQQEIRLTTIEHYDHSKDAIIAHHQTDNGHHHNITRTSNSTDEPTENCNLIKSKMKFNFAKYKDLWDNRNIIVDFLAILFGIGSWIGVNAVYLQLPLLVNVAPEGWSLPSFLVVVIQIGNIGPLSYTLYQKYAPRKLVDSYVIYGLYVVGSIAAITMAFCYHYTAFVAGANRSVALLSLVFAFALVGCTSSVLFMPYMGRFKEMYLITYLIGEGLSGFVPSILALIQGVGGNPECIPTNSTDGLDFIQYTSPPLFETRDFFIFVFSIMVLSGIAFTLLNNLKVCKLEYAKGVISLGNNYQYDKEKTDETQLETDEKKYSTKNDKELSEFNYKYLMILMGIVSLIGSGVFPGIQSYSCLPYGNIVYHLTVTLSSIANPIACLMAVFLPHTSVKNISILSFILTIISAYAMATAVLSPTPPLLGQAIGEALVVICWTLSMGLISYIKLSITSVFRYQGGRSLVWIGSMSQGGSAIGAIITYVLVNHANVFISYQPCSSS